MQTISDAEMRRRVVISSTIGNALEWFDFTVFGLFAGVMGGFPARMPYKVGLEWTLTGDPMSAQRACEIGFVNAISAPGEHVQAAFALAQRIAANAPMVVRAIKHLALETLPRNPMADYYPHRQMLDAIAGSEDAREGARAFREKRPPKFEGR